MNRRQFTKLSAMAALGVTAQFAGAEEFSYPWKLGIITDEVSFDLAETISKFYPKYGLKWAELRSLDLNGKKKYVYKNASSVEIKEIKKQLDDAGLKLSVLDTAFYKIPLPGTHALHEEATELNPSEGVFEKQMEELKRAADAAHALGTDKLRIFTFSRIADPDSIFKQIVEHLNNALIEAKKLDVVLVVENEHSCNTATGTETAKLFKAISDKRLAHNWDPGNCFEGGEEPFPKAWDMLDHKRIVHIHLKDAAGKAWKPMGGGEIDYIGQFKALKKMHYSGTMSLETHYRNAERNLFNSSVESMDGLVGLLKKV